MPLTTVKNIDQVSGYGQLINTPVPIAVPEGVDPQAMVNTWSTLGNWSVTPPGAPNPFSDNVYDNSLPYAFFAYWVPFGPNDFKRWDSPMYDASANFLYGATGTALGLSPDTLLLMGDLTHASQNFQNFPQNTADITSGITAISNGGTLRTQEYNPGDQIPLPNLPNTNLSNPPDSTASSTASTSVPPSDTGSGGGGGDPCGGDPCCGDPCCIDPSSC